MSRPSPASALVALALLAGACTRLPTGPAAARPGGVRGITLAAWSRDGYASPAADSAIAGLAATGANTMVLIVTAYQAGTDDTLRAGDPRTPSPAALAHAIAVARARGLRVVLKPHVDLDDGRWRGLIAPTDPARWFVSYRAFLLPLAVLAESTGCAGFVVGTELAGTVASEAEWRATLRAVRAAFPGTVTYAASWDETTRIPFWDALDAVGVDAYFPVAVRPDAGRLDDLAGWQPWLERLRELHARAGRPLLLTEIGYRSLAGAGERPYDGTATGRPDAAEQASLYWAALQAVAREGWIEGVCWWDWPADGSGAPGGTDYTP
ncbi:MAG TPA: hypothetical protein VGU27_02765, partial [Candidatus Eisenbacteria bacterium]|nr:hypothetical protein [Candidatus Eisenbacteria bacterium]